MATKYTLWELDCNVLFFQKNQVVVTSSWFTERKKKCMCIENSHLSFSFMNFLQHLVPMTTTDNKWDQN